jgi:hypothetical protein
VSFALVILAVCLFFGANDLSIQGAGILLFLLWAVW